MTTKNKNRLLVVRDGKYMYMIVSQKRSDDLRFK